MKLTQRIKILFAPKKRKNKYRGSYCFKEKSIGIK